MDQSKNTQTGVNSSSSEQTTSPQSSSVGNLDAKSSTDKLSNGASDGTGNDATACDSPELLTGNDAATSDSPELLTGNNAATSDSPELLTGNDATTSDSPELLRSGGVTLFEDRK